MKTIKVTNGYEIPKNYTGIAEYTNGTKVWLKEGNLHREDGPAIEYEDGYKAWWIEGSLRREDGPAVEYSNGIKLWYLEGKYYNNKIPSNSIILDTYKDQRYQKIIFYKVLTSEKVVTIPIWEELKINE